MNPALSISRRTRSTPFTTRVTEAGVKAYTVYNHMLLPTVFESVEADYHHLKKHVQVWDVSCQRQVEVKGPDAAALVQMITPRNLAKMSNDQCYYIPVVDDTGGMLNDPVAVRHNKNRWWISLADSDVGYWLRGLANGHDMDVYVFEPDVCPLAVQGPKSDELMSRVFGEDVKNLRFFRHKAFKFEDTTFTIARSGYSVQGGYEIYVEGAEYGEPLWDALFEAGKDLNVRAGGPNLIERIEGGLLSYGNDMTYANTPFEAGLGRFCNDTTVNSCIGAAAMRREIMHGSKQRIRGLRISGDAVPACTGPWPVVTETGLQVGYVTSAAWSPDFDTNVAIGMISRSHWKIGNKLTVRAPDAERPAVLCKLPFA